MHKGEVRASLESSIAEIRAALDEVQRLQAESNLLLAEAALILKLPDCADCDEESMGVLDLRKEIGIEKGCIDESE